MPRPTTEMPVMEETGRVGKVAGCVMLPGWWRSAMGRLGLLARKTFSLIMGPRVARRLDCVVCVSGGSLVRTWRGERSGERVR